jgi:signal transduction histidine kinase
MNLLINARQAMQEGGEITIRTALKKKNNVVIIDVEDTGCGIYKKNIDRIFDPFFTTKAPGKGTGLGLAVIYGIVKQHGGEIEVKSSPGKGSTFTILISAN